MRFIILLFPLLFLACGEAEVRVYSDEAQELSYNYRLLKSYFYRPERIKEYEEYVGMEVDSMYESLKDYFCGANYEGNCGNRYTYYLPPEKSDDKIIQIENTPRYYSFGFERGKKEDTLIVLEVYPISPAFDAGLKKRDRLLSANGISLIGEKAVDYLEKDDKFDNPTVFVVLRDGKEKTLPAMHKAEIQEPTVFLDWLEGIPYIQVTGYKVNTNNPRGTYYEFKNILDSIKGAKAAIMDLRYNPGGSIAHCTAMAAELVPYNSMLLYDVQRRGNTTDTLPDFAYEYLYKEGDGVNIKWVILINKWSASCSERFTAAVKYNRPDETVIIGQTSYGKGVGQVYGKTYLGGLAYITSLQTFYPNGKTFHDIGIEPDIIISPEDTTNALYNETMKAAKQFSLAKRSPTSASTGALPPKRRAEDMEPGAYIRVEMPLFHQWE